MEGIRAPNRWRFVVSRHRIMFHDMLVIVRGSTTGPGVPCRHRRWRLACSLRLDLIGFRVWKVWKAEG